MYSKTACWMLYHYIVYINIIIFQYGEDIFSIDSHTSLIQATC